ncbi:MAG: CBS domain-containing protein [Fulvivirga sp.]|nr:CBS domain-containing protein [Fulvivirga sp.]
MVKSFQGVRQEKPKKSPVQDVHVKDYMTPKSKLITFHPDQTMDDVIKTLLDKKISGGPVIDDEGKLVGIISEGDCLKEVVKGKYTHTPVLHGKASEHMATDVKTMDAELNIFDAAGKFLEMKLRRFPVLKDGKLLGQISQRDVMQAVQNLKDSTW